jgi:hypothetical protein
MRHTACCQVSHAAQASGFKPVCGVEMDAIAASSFCANLPAAGGNEMPLQDFLVALRQREAGMPGGLLAAEPKHVATLPLQHTSLMLPPLPHCRARHHRILARQPSLPGAVASQSLPQLPPPAARADAHAGAGKRCMQLRS